MSDIHSEENLDRWKRAKDRHEYLSDGKYPGMSTAGLRRGSMVEDRRSWKQELLPIVVILALIFAAFAILERCGIV